MKGLDPAEEKKARWILKCCSADISSSSSSSFAEEDREMKISRSVLELREKGIKEGFADSFERSLAWSVFLGVGELNSSHYFQLVSRGPCAADTQIRDDVRRTFRSDNLFAHGKRDAEMRRILTALRHDRNEIRQLSGGANRCGICAAFLAALPTELDAYYTLKLLVSRHCPTYFTPTLLGATAGSALVSACLQIADPHYHALLLRAASCHLSHHQRRPKYRKNASDSLDLNSLVVVKEGRSSSDNTHETWRPALECRPRAATTTLTTSSSVPTVDAYSLNEERASLFEDLCAFPLLASFMTCAPPLSEILRLWDLLFALGPHCIVLLVTAIFLERKNDVIHASDPVRLLQPRSLPKINAEAIVRRVQSLLPLIPSALHDLMLSHATVSLDRPTIRRSCFKVILSQPTQSPTSPLPAHDDAHTYDHFFSSPPQQQHKVCSRMASSDFDEHKSSQPYTFEDDPSPSSLHPSPAHSPSSSQTTAANASPSSRKEGGPLS